jgi:hypothetical protein
LPGRKRLDRDRRAAGPVRCGIHRAGRAAATRNPRLLFRLSGVFLLRFADRQFAALLFQPTPRFTRFGVRWPYSPEEIRATRKPMS